MIQLNTTFCVDPSVENSFLAWVRETYIPDAVASGIFSSPRLLRIEHEVQPDALTYAVQLTAEHEADARLWHDTGRGFSLRSDIMNRYPQKVLFFSTFMDILPL